MFMKAVLRMTAVLLALGSTARAWAARPATLDAPAAVPAGSVLKVVWTGPGQQWDRIGIVPANAPDWPSPGTPQSTYASGKAVTISVPDQPGAYEVRYYSHNPRSVLARRTFTALPVTASLDGPARAIAGSTVDVKWTGPNNGSDRIHVLRAGAPEGTSSSLSVPVGSSPARVTVPDVPGDYEFRYLTAQSHVTLARAAVTVTGTTASIRGPGTAVAGTYINVSWTGPGNEYDSIKVSPKGSAEDRWVSSAAINHSNPAVVRAPLVAGEYELRYQTGQTHATLARDDLRVTPAREEPGSVRVLAAQGVPTAEGAVEIIVDTSGSMLQKIGSQRRIDIAKSTLKNLTGKVIPAGTPFALRVFGRQPDSCETELDIAAHPLDPAAVARKIDALTARSKAKTPIAASLAKVADDLSNVRGERLVILVTDGEETCGGDPDRTIQQLMKRGIDVRINIVGFAVDDRKTAAMFRQWSNAGGGDYFDAKSADSLNEAFTLAVKARFEVVDANKRVVADGLVGGAPVKVLPGAYTVRVRGRSFPVTVQPKQTSNVSL